ncbi:unnamed protein product [Plutella xylostella]|uniref:(diamondback moth) hypothetical protein n=1 Tax=Plutella xylostella TaxID=51655 RepID=A0A8S4G4A3_PLUXY|nr:unnamed protein product [Plutella xylostella]
MALGIWDHRYMRAQLELGGVWSLRNVSISVPRGVLSGEGAAVSLRCDYDLEGAALYSIRWYRGDTEFYRYVPREMPPTMVFPLPAAASVDLSASDASSVRVVGLHRRLSGVFACEVSADAPLFHTDIRAAPLTIVDPPFRAPRLWVSRASYVRGGVITANCSVDGAFPPANLTWTIDGHKIAEHVSPAPASELDFSEAPARSRLELTVLEAEAYRVGLSYTSGGLSYSSDQQFYPDHAVYDVRDGSSKQETDPPLRYTLPAPASGQLTLRCVASIYDVWARGAEPAALREDKPRPASVTGDDSAGARVAPQAAALLAGALLLLL